MTINSSLTIRVSDLTPELLLTIKDDLTLRNTAYDTLKRFSKFKINTNYTPEHLVFYKTSTVNGEQVITIPRNYPVTVTSLHNYNKHLPANFTFLKDLRKYQNDFLLPLLNCKYKDMIFEVPCGHGKTTKALYYASKLKVKTIILLPTNYLLKQWLVRIKQFTDTEGQVLSSDLLKKLYNNSNQLHTFIQTNDLFIITFDMYTSCLNKKETSSTMKEIVNACGLVIFDEAHKLGADTYHPIMETLPCEYRLALTATMRRTDGRDTILRYHFGTSFAMPNQYPPAKFYRVNLPYEFDSVQSTKKLPQEDYEKLALHIIDNDIKCSLDYDYFAFKLRGGIEKTRLCNISPKVKRVVNEKPSATSIDSFVTTYAKTVKSYQTIITKCLENGRTVIVLSKRKQILKTLYKIYENLYPTALVISETNKQTPEKEDFLNNQAKLILGINQLAEFGLDIDRLDTLIYLHPVVDTEQSIGRILRYVEGKKQPLVFMPLINVPLYNGIYRKCTNFVTANASLEKSIELKEVQSVLWQNENLMK